MNIAPWIRSFGVGLAFVLASAEGDGVLSACRAQTNDTRPCQDIIKTYHDAGKRDLAISMIHEYIVEHGFALSDVCGREFLRMFREHGATETTAFEGWLRWTFHGQKSRADIDRIVDFFQDGTILEKLAVQARDEYLTVRAGDIQPDDNRADIGDTLRFTLIGRNGSGDDGEEIAGQHRSLTQFGKVRVDVEPSDRGNAWFPSDAARSRGEGYFVGRSAGEAKLIFKGENLSKLGETVITVFDDFQLEFDESFYDVPAEGSRVIRVKTQDGRNLEAGERLNVEVTPPDAFKVVQLEQNKTDWADFEVTVVNPAQKQATLTVSKKDGRGRALTGLRISNRSIEFAASRYDGHENDDIEGIELGFSDREAFGGLTAKYWTDPPDMAAISVSAVARSARVQVVDLRDLRWPPDQGEEKSEFRLWAGIEDLGIETSVPIRVLPNRPTMWYALASTGATVAAAFIANDRRGAKNDKYDDGVARRDAGAGQDELDRIYGEVTTLRHQETVGWVVTGLGVLGSAYLWWSYFAQQREYTEKASMAQAIDMTPILFATADGKVGLSIRF